MRRLLILCTIAVSAFAGSLSAGDSKKDLDALQGNWHVVSVKESDGKDPPEDYLKLLSVDVKGDVMKISKKGGDVIVVFKLKLDAGKNPKTVDCIHDGDPKDLQKGKIDLGIYKIEGDVVTFCTNTPGAPDRPTAFATKEKTKYQVAVLKKAK